MDKNNHLFLVDGSGYIFRSYHALPPLTRKSDGLPVGAVAGFCNMLWKLLCDARNTAAGVVPSHFAVIFDYSSKTFRKEISQDYKANRPTPPEDLIPQFSLIRQATRAFNVPSIEKEGYEADDIIATFAKKASDIGLDTTIISSDKDLMQLVSDKIFLYDSMKDKHIGIREVIEKFGVTPKKMIDFQALIGDTSDNIFGIPGIGPKTAALLLSEFGDLDTLLANAHLIKQQKRRENLMAYKEQCLIARQLVTLKQDVSLEETLDDLLLKPQDGTKLIGFLKAMEFNTLTRRVAQATECDASLIEPATIILLENDKIHGPDIQAPFIFENNNKMSDVETFTPENTIKNNELFANNIDSFHEDKSLSFMYDNVNSAQKLAKTIQQKLLEKPIKTDAYVTITDEKILQQWLEEATDLGFFAFDTETTSLDPLQAELVGFSIALAEGKAAYIPLQHMCSEDDLLGGGLVKGQIAIQRAIALLRPVLENPAILKIAQNMKYDWLVMRNYGITLQSFDDTMLMSYVLSAGANSHGMDALAKQWFSHQTISYKDVTNSGKTAICFAKVDIEKATQYAAEDADITLRLWFILKQQLIAKGLTHVYQTLERPLVVVLAKMEERGILVDKQILARLSFELAQSAKILEDEIYQLADEKFNIASPKQLGDILFGKMGFKGGRKTKTGQWSTSASTLEDLAEFGHSLPRKIVDWRQMNKLKSTYTDALPNFILAKSGRVHTNYSMAATTTGRLASFEPNLQNIPIRTSEGRKIRTAFIAKEGHLLISADYSQIELRILAHIADIASLKKAFQQGVDIHTMTASEIFQHPIATMPSDIRRKAKAINFGIIYGISAFGLANQLSISREEAGAYIKNYFEKFPGIKNYMEETKAFAKENGYVETIFGRRSYYPEINNSNVQIRNFNERAAINARIQGSAADIIKRAMIKMDDALLKHDLKAKMLLQVHDELIFEVPEEEAQKTIKVIKDVMENATMPAISLSVPLVVDARAAKNWDEAH